jgi:hypothetical protein
MKYDRKVPLATGFDHFFCDKCKRLHVVLFKRKNEPFAQFSVPEAWIDEMKVQFGLHKLSKPAGVGS